MMKSELCAGLRDAAMKNARLREEARGEKDGRGLTPLAAQGAAIRIPS
jgi:hypothetical protein